MFVLLAGLFLSPMLALMFKGSLWDNGGILLAGILVMATFALVSAMNVGACHQDWMGRPSCNSVSVNIVYGVGAGVGILQVGGLTLALYRVRRGRARRAILALGVRLSVATFAIAIFSIGIFFILAAWGLLGWLAIKNPPLRESELTLG